MYRLRELEMNDIKIINEWRNDQELIANLGAPYRYINQDVDIKWFENYMCERNRTVRCAIVDSINDKEILGLISLLSIDTINRKAELHIMIGSQQNRGKGIGTFAVNEMLKHAFYNLNLYRIELEALETNNTAIHLYEKCGFVYEGKKRKAIYKNGKYIDMIMMGLIKDDWHDVCREL